MQRYFRMQLAVGEILDDLTSPAWAAVDELEEELADDLELRLVLRLTRAHRDALLAHQAESQGDEASGRRLRDQALGEALAVRDDFHTGRSLDVRLALSWLERALGRGRSDPRLGPADLTISATGSWFQFRDAAMVSVTQPVLQRLLAQLVEAYGRRPGEPVTVSDLQAAAWQDAGSEPRTGRLAVAISRLRRLGLGKVLQHVADGYLLDRTVPIQRVE
jgi:hypothetical protein